ncbi:unnamed protein product, partial [Adineta steineri]
MLPKLFTLTLIVIYLNYASSKCIWYEGINNGFNQAYLNGEPKPLPLEDIGLLNEMCPHIPTREGESPKLCCDRKQLAEMQKFKYIIDNLIGRCPSCYFNFLRIFCEMSCNPNQDEFIWPLNFLNISRPNEQAVISKDDNDENIREEWALADYSDPDEEDEDKKVVTKPAEMVQ